jgi:hypothetical protein
MVPETGGIGGRATRKRVVSDRDGAVAASGATVTAPLPTLLIEEGKHRERSVLCAPAAPANQFASTICVTAVSICFRQ